jgi:hypothetical protein
MFSQFLVSTKLTLKHSFETHTLIPTKEWEGVRRNGKSEGIGSPRKSENKKILKVSYKAVAVYLKDEEIHQSKWPSLIRDSQSFYVPSRV